MFRPAGFLWLFAHELRVLWRGSILVRTRKHVLAPVLVIAVSELAFAKTGHPNRNAFYDTGAAVANLSVEATSRGLFVHQMAGFDPHKAIELFEIPTGWEPISAFTIGYPGNPETLPETLRHRELAPRERKPLDTFVMGGHWGKTASFLQK